MAESMVEGFLGCKDNAFVESEDLECEAEESLSRPAFICGAGELVCKRCLRSGVTV